ncbi:MAG: PaaI family thioesterase, partial [Spongiibacter marinus]|uniref:PaaI family thioesterase n=1 Tax=Spongiibacter marinus TaxID=354246 RepID=UPI003C56DC5A
MALDLQELRRFVDVVLQSNPGDHFTTLGIAVEAVEHHHVQMSMPYRESLIGDPDTGVLHGGAITALLDTCCGFAAATALDDLGMTPTIDLRIDYMRAATPGQTITTTATCHHVTR